MSLTHLNRLVNHLITSFLSFNHFTLFICLFVCLTCLDNKFAHTSPLIGHSNPLNQYLREPEIVKVYKEKVVLRVYPFTKKDMRVSDYYLIVESVDDKSNSSAVVGPNIDNIDFSLNYYNSVRRGLHFFAAVHLYGDLFYGSSRKFVTIIIGQHQIDLTKPREFRADAYVNPLLVCGRHYRIGIAALLDRSKSSKKEFIYVPSSRTIIMNENGSCDSTDTYELFFILSFIALVLALISFCLLLTYNTLATGEDYKGDYDQIGVSKSKIKSFKLDSKSNPIPLSILFDYYNQMNREHAFTKEFNSVLKSKLFSWKIATLKINQKKNRYLELLPYDINRVVLRRFPSEDDFIESEKFNSKTLSKGQLEYVHLKPTCYINASYIDVLDNAGNLIRKRYIATQGPLRNTINDFWKMVYQTQCSQVIMLANVMEKGKIKCEKYWPDLKHTEIYGHLTCTCIEETVFADYTIRVIRLELKDSASHVLVKNNNYINVKSDTGREVIQYHFMRWDDHYVPEYSDSVALLLNSVRSHWSYRKPIDCDSNDDRSDESMNEFELRSKERQLSPIIVHGTAGVGRSSVLMTIDSLLEQAVQMRDASGEFENLSLDVLKQFANIRKQRVFSIERINQYAFVHQVLMEMLCSRHVKDIEPKNFNDYYTMLKESSIKPVNDLKNISRLEEQFNILNKFKTQLDDDSRSIGLLNLKKNRNKQSIPENKARVQLPVVDDDYINALYVNGFRHFREFIVTEIPTQEMRYAFWLMINDQNIDTICLLNKIEHNLYWPTELNVPHVYKELEIELMSEEKTTDYHVKRKFRINKKKIVYQLHYNHWDNISRRPTNITSYCLYMKAVQMHLNRNSFYPNQFVVQCLNGVSASGVYCVTKHVVDRMLCDNQINIFLSTKYIRTNRMEFIEDNEQYNFLFEYIQLIAKSFYSKDYKNLCFSMH